MTYNVFGGTLNLTQPNPSSEKNNYWSVCVFMKLVTGTDVLHQVADQ